MFMCYRKTSFNLFCLKNIISNKNFHLTNLKSQEPIFYFPLVCISSFYFILNLLVSLYLFILVFYERAYNTFKKGIIVLYPYNYYEEKPLLLSYSP